LVERSQLIVEVVFLVVAVGEGRFSLVERSQLIVEGLRRRRRSSTSTIINGSL
jgi:hypothetical protein